MCFGIYAGLDEIDVLFQIIMRFQNCYKILINCFYDYEIWTGEDALYIDKCSQSTKTEVNMLDNTYGPYEGELFGESDENTIKTGYTDPTICSPGQVTNPLTGYLPAQF